MDAWWERLIRAVYDPVIGDAGRIPIGFDNAPGLQGSAYQDGFYGYLWTDLSMVLGDPVKSPTSQIYCGGSPRVRRRARRVRQPRAGLARRRRRCPRRRPGRATRRLGRRRRRPSASASCPGPRSACTGSTARPPSRSPCSGPRRRRASARARSGASAHGPAAAGSASGSGPFTMSPVTVEVRRQSRGRRIGRARRVEALRGRHGELPLARPRRLGARLLRGQLQHPRARRHDRRPPGGGPPRPRQVPARSGARARDAPAARSVASPCAARCSAAPAGRSRWWPCSSWPRASAPTVVVRRGRRTVKRFRARSYAAGRPYGLRLSPRGLPRGKYRVILRVAGGARMALVARRL